MQDLMLDLELMRSCAYKSFYRGNIGEVFGDWIKASLEQQVQYRDLLHQFDWFATSMHHHLP